MQPDQTEVFWLEGKIYIYTVRSIELKWNFEISTTEKIYTQECFEVVILSAFAVSYQTCWLSWKAMTLHV